MLIFTQPFLIKSVLNLLGRPEDKRSRTEGYGLVAATALIYLGIAVGSNPKSSALLANSKPQISILHSSYSLFRFTTMFRGAMIALIYERALRLKDGVAKDSSALSLSEKKISIISKSRNADM